MNSFVTIIIPVYNAASLLEKCLKSLSNQSYPFLELIFINDCSSDSSLEVLNAFYEKITSVRESFRVIIASHEENRGVANARNTGLSLTTGKYIYYVDADDYLQEDAIEKLVNLAESTQADIVGCDWILQFEKNGRIMHQPAVDSGEMAIEYMAKGTMRWNLWLFLVKAELYTKYNISFTPGMNMGEDMVVMFKLMNYAKKISMLKESLYFYNQANSSSLTKVYSVRHKQEVQANLKALEVFFLQNERKEERFAQLNYLKLNIKLPLLIANSVDQYKEWKTWFPESNGFIDSNDLISKRIKWLQRMAVRENFWLLKMHYYVVIKFVYGIVYR